MVGRIQVVSKYVAPSQGFFEIKKGSSVYRLMEKMTPAMTQDRLAEFYEAEKQKGNPLPLNSIQMFGIMEDAVRAGDTKLMNFLQDGLRKWPNTLTRVIYNPAGEKDEIIHNYGTSGAYSLFGDIVGLDGWVSDIKDKLTLKSLLGISDTRKLNRVSNKINSTQMYVWRLNSKPSKKDERVVRFNANSDWLDLNAYRYPLDEYPAFRVLQVE